MKFYDWGKTHSYTNCTVFFVIGGRSIGKTYGLRKKNIWEYIRKGSRWVEIIRTESDLSDFENDYFAKLELNGEFPGYQFKIESDRAYIAKQGKDDEKPEWELMGYFLPLTKEQKIKQRTFVNVKNFTFDEAIIDKNISPYTRYLPNEWKSVLGIVNTALREIPGQKMRGVRINLLGNACDLTCPFFESLGINKIPPLDSRTFYGEGDAEGNNKIMVHRLPPSNTSYITETIVGILSNKDQAAQFYGNEFSGETSDFIINEPIPKTAKHMFNVLFGRKFGVYLDIESCCMYIGRPIEKNRTYVIAREDMTVEYTMLAHADTIKKTVKEMYAVGAVRYENSAYMGAFYNMLTALNIY